jgi:lipopolysaccharide transport system permease protein
MLMSLYQYRKFILRSSLEELRHRYAGSTMGVLWNIFIPLMQIGIYTIVFTTLYYGRSTGPIGRFANNQFAYVFFLCAGFLPWFGFADCITQGTNSLLANARYLTKMALPEAIFMAKVAVSATITTLTSLLLMILLGIPVGLPIGWSYLAVPLVVVLFQSFGFGVVLVLGTLNVFFQDVRQAIGLILHMWMWLTPIIYSEELLPAWLRPWLHLNPTYSFITAFRQLFMFDQIPSPQLWATMIGWAIVSIACGWLVLSRLRDDLRDTL